MAFARLLRNLLRDPASAARRADRPRRGPHLRPRRPHQEVKIYAPEGQRYTPVDSELLLPTPRHRRADPRGGHHRGRRHGGFTALATAYATWGQPMLPFFLFYSMFGFQRVGDLIWALGDMRGRGFLAGCTAGRTTLQGEGLQHDDGHSPCCWPRSTCPRLRPGLRLRDRDHRADGIGRMYGEARGPLLLPHPLQRELPDAPQARGRGRGHPARVSTASPERPRGRARGPTVLFSGPRGRRPGGAAAPGRGPRRGGRTVVGDQLQSASGGRPLGGALEPPPPLGAARTPYVTEALADAAGRSWP
jgi:hypothetical protein